MTDYLVTMRLVDMRRMHPSQDNTRVCSQCRRYVGIYPTGQRALLRRPDLRIMCNRCLPPPAPPLYDVRSLPAGPMDEIIQEMRDSREERKQ
jgi:hypothetical protein